MKVEGERLEVRRKGRRGGGEEEGGGGVSFTVFLNRAHSSGVSVSALAMTGMMLTWAGREGRYR